MSFISLPAWGDFAFAGLLIGIVLIVFWILMLVDCAKNRFRKDWEKFIWILVIVFINWIGALAYLIAIKILNPKGILSK